MTGSSCADRRVSTRNSPRKLETSVLCEGRLFRFPCKPGRQLGARPDAELAVDAGQRRLDRVLGQEERRGDFAVRAALGDKGGNPALALRQVAARGRPSSDSTQFGPYLASPKRRAQIFEDRERALERRPRRPALLRPPLGRPQREKRPC